MLKKCDHNRYNFFVIQVKEFIGSPFADPRKVHASLAKNDKFSLWIDTERLKTTNQNDESLGMVSVVFSIALVAFFIVHYCSPLIAWLTFLFR